MKYSILLSLLLLISNISLAQLTPNDKAETDLSTTITDQELISVIAESEFDTSLIIIVDFQKWAQKENLYIAVAYFVSDKDRKDNYIKTNKIICDEESERIGIFMLEFKDSLHFIGKYHGGPSLFESDFNTFKYDGLYFDNYKVADDKTAFGLKTRTYAYYSGGSMTYDALKLFIKDGNELINNI